MALELLEYIGNTIKDRNDLFDTYHVNGVQLPDGKVIQFTDQKEKQFIGIGDNQGSAFYIRFNPQVNFQTTERRLTSSKSSVAAVKQCRLVAFTWDPEVGSEALLHTLISDLRRIQFSQLAYKQRPTISIRRTNHNYLENLTEELRKEPERIPQEFTCVSIDFDLKYYPGNCDECPTPHEVTCNYDF